MDSSSRNDHLHLQHNINTPKASNLPATALIIGDWKCESCNTGDLIAKIYYGRRRFVWEVLVGALKWKMEIKWSHIIAIKLINYANHQSGILQIQLNEQPSFFRETHTQPRKHTTWEPSHDFTGGHALVSRIHCLVFPPKTLDKHYIQLLQCDERLLALSSASSCQQQQTDHPILFPSHPAYNNFMNESRLLNHIIHAQADAGTTLPPQQYHHLTINYPTSTPQHQDFSMSPAVINMHQHGAQHKTTNMINWNQRSTSNLLELGINNNIVQLGGGGETCSNYNYNNVHEKDDLQMNIDDTDDNSSSVEIMEDWNAINGMSPQECIQWLMSSK